MVNYLRGRISARKSVGLVHQGALELYLDFLLKLAELLLDLKVFRVVVLLVREKLHRLFVPILSWTAPALAPRLVLDLLEQRFSQPASLRRELMLRKLSPHPLLLVASLCRAL